MSDAIAGRDYSLVGEQNRIALESGLANAQWYQTPIPRPKLRELMKRSDGPAIRDTLIWVAAFIVTGVGGGYFWGSWWGVPFFFAYGVLYGSSTDSRWHECGHRTAFKTVWMNDVVYQIASFMVLREPDVWRWSHTRHHTDTIIIGRDPEIAVPRPPKLWKLALSFVGIPQAIDYFKKVFHHAGGSLLPDEATFIPDSERARVYWTARVHLLIYAVVIAWAIAAESLLPLMYVGLPSLYGAWLYLTTGLTQHAGLAEDVLDHRLNCRTVYMNPVVRFLYWNMNYHVEHHMFPMVPYHQLAKLHEEMKPDTPRPYRGFWEAYREIIPAVLRQVREPGYFVRRDLPPSANPTPAAALVGRHAKVAA